MRVAVCGERGDVLEAVRVGPVLLHRYRRWDDARTLATLLREAGAEAVVVDTPRPTEDADVWVLSDLPRPAAADSGVYRAVTRSLANGSRLLVLGGALSYGGQQGAGGWQDDPLLPVLSSGDDTEERPEGIRALPADGTDSALVPCWSSYGYNRVTARDGSRVLASFTDRHPALVLGADGRSLAWMSDLMPHWGPRPTDGAAVVGWLRAALSLLAEGEN